MTVSLCHALTHSLIHSFIHSLLRYSRHLVNREATAGRLKCGRSLNTIGKAQSPVIDIGKLERQQLTCTYDLEHSKSATLSRQSVTDLTVLFRHRIACLPLRALVVRLAYTLSAIRAAMHCIYASSSAQWHSAISSSRSSALHTGKSIIWMILTKAHIEV